MQPLPLAGKWVVKLCAREVNVVKAVKVYQGPYAALIRLNADDEGDLLEHGVLRFFMTLTAG